MSLEEEKFYAASVVVLRSSKTRKQYEDGAKNVINQNRLSSLFFFTMSLISGLFQSAFVGCRDSDFRNSSNHSLASYCATTEEKYFKLTWIASHIFSTSIRLIIAMLFFFVSFFPAIPAGDKRPNCIHGLSAFSELYTNTSSSQQD